MALVWGGGREQRAEVGGPRRAAAASPLARACSGCRWGGVGRARNGHGVETLCASRSARPPYRPRRGAGGCWGEQQTKTKARPAQRGHGPPYLTWFCDLRVPWWRIKSSVSYSRAWYCRRLPLPTTASRCSGGVPAGDPIVTNLRRRGTIYWPTTPA